MGNSAKLVATPTKLLSDKSSELYCSFRISIAVVRKYVLSITCTHYLRICLYVLYTHRWSQKNGPFVRESETRGGGGGWKKGKRNYVTALCDPSSRSENFSSDSNEILQQVKRLISLSEK